MSDGEGVDDSVSGKISNGRDMPEEEGDDAEDRGEEMVRRCEALYKDDKVFEAHRLEQRLAKEHPDLHANNAEVMAEISEVAAEAEHLNSDLDSSDGRWVCVKDAKNPGDVRVWYRAEEGSALHTIRCDYDMDAPLEYILVLLNEIQLLHKWMPFIGGSDELSHPSRCERVAWVKIRSPTPLVLYHRDMCFYGRAIDGLDEDGCILVMCRSSVDGEHGAAHPPLESRTTRMGLDYGAVQFIPLSLGRTRIRGICKVDPKLDSLPPWLMNWIATKVCWVGLRLWEWKAKKLANSDEEGKEHKQRMVDDAVFYDWMIARVRDSLEKREQEGKQIHVEDRKDAEQVSVDLDGLDIASSSLSPEALPI